LMAFIVCWSVGGDEYIGWYRQWDRHW